MEVPLAPDVIIGKFIKDFISMLIIPNVVIQPESSYSTSIRGHNSYISYPKSLDLDY